MRPLIQLCNTSVSLIHRMIGIDALHRFLREIFAPNQGIVGFYLRSIVFILTFSLCALLLAIILIHPAEHP